ncbi:unnamed protein product [Lactuca virosa]|uniref:HAT C-terminal dimerisation domain-containing protein n=1 Tax=Lactuca virosa TaxID=75947 RepID=A0AAU9MWQ4_9ASTR|nr:unnamed protein product [Lactuca virosa]
MNVQSLLPFLKIFFDATSRFSGSKYVTSNAYVHEIFGIGNVIDGFTMHPDKSIMEMAKKMKLKYKKYWGDVTKLNQFMFIGVVLDPRHKWKYIQWVVKENFEKYSANRFIFNLDYNVCALFDFYQYSMPQKEKDVEVSSTYSPSDPNSAWGDDMVMDIEVIMTKKFKMAMGSSDTTSKKTKLDKYLGEEREPMDTKFRHIVVVEIQQCIYPILSKMARDILAIPISTVASESAFSTGGRVLDSFRTSLTPRMVEALICAQDWLRSSRKPIVMDDILLEIEKLEENGLKELTLEQPIIIIDESVDESDITEE